MDKPSGILTFTTGGVAHIELLQQHYEWLDRVKRDAVALHKKSANAEPAPADDAPGITTGD